MLLIIQLVLYCLLFFLMVKTAVKDNGMNCLYFYPPAFIDEAARRGLADKDETMKRGKRFMVPFSSCWWCWCLLLRCGTV